MSILHNPRRGPFRWAANPNIQVTASILQCVILKTLSLRWKIKRGPMWIVLKSSWPGIWLLCGQHLDGTASPWSLLKLLFCALVSSLLAICHANALVLLMKKPPFWVEMAWEGYRDRHKAGQLSCWIMRCLVSWSVGVLFPNMTWCWLLNCMHNKLREGEIVRNESGCGELDATRLWWAQMKLNPKEL